MPKTESVLVSASIVVTAPTSDSLPEDAMIDAHQEAFLDSVADRLRASVRDLEQESWFEQDLGSSYHYLSPETHFPEKNAGRCAECGRWTSDVDEPDFLILLVIGSTVDGKLVCNECRYHGDETANGAAKE